MESNHSMSRETKCPESGQRAGLRRIHTSSYVTHRHHIRIICTRVLPLVCVSMGGRSNGFHLPSPGRQGKNEHSDPEVKSLGPREDMERECSFINLIGRDHSHFSLVFFEKYKVTFFPAGGSHSCLHQKGIL